MTGRAGFFGIGGMIARFLRSTRGVAAIEFAFIAPVLLSIYFVTMEVSQGIETNKKVGRVASMAADLITQLPETTKADLEAIMDIAGAVLQPYNRSDPTIEITAIRITDEETPRVEVVWSRKKVGDVFSEVATEGSLTTVPERLEIRGTFLIRVKVSLHYLPVIVWTAEQKSPLGLAAAFDEIAMGETYHLRPRVSNEIDCTDC